jgi:hypothetical protein
VASDAACEETESECVLSNHLSICWAEFFNLTDLSIYWAEFFNLTDTVKKNWCSARLVYQTASMLVAVQVHIAQKPPGHWLISASQ